jgi:hypothetical protein
MRKRKKRERKNIYMYEKRKKYMSMYDIKIK